MALKVALSSIPIKYQSQALIVGKDNLYTTAKAKFAKSAHPIVSEEANTCVMLGLNGGNADCLMHLAPEQQPIRTLAKGLEKCIETLKEKMANVQDDITGILIGGRHSGNAASFNLFIEVAKILDRFEIPFSMICGKFDNIANDNILINGCNTKIWNPSLKNVKFTESASQEEIENALQTNYEVVELSDKVPISIS